MKRITTCLVVILTALSGFAEVPQLINYQGRLLNGTNLANGSVGLSLRLYNTSSGGALLYEDSNSVMVVDGLYSTFIGDQTNSGNFASALTNAQVWIETAVNGTALTPRERLTSAAYALRAEMAQGVSVNGITATMLTDGAVTGVKIASNTITTEQLADGAVTGAKIAANTITSIQVADGGLTAANLATALRVGYTAIPNPAPAAYDHFGNSVAEVGSNRFVVGASDDDAGAANAGSAYLYDLNGTLLATITNPAPAISDYFGCSVAGVGSNRFVVGAYSDDAGATDAGSVYLYDFNGNLLATITNPAPAVDDYFGSSVAGVGSNRFVVGAYQDDAGAANAGNAYLYDLTGTLLATITNPAPAVDDYFGSSVAGIGTNRFVVGAFGDDAGANNAGSAYLYDLTGTLLATITNPAPAANDYFGCSVAGVGSNRFVVGAYQDDAGAANAGSAYLYDLNGTLLATITNPAPAISDYFGYSVAGVGSNHFVVGTSYDDAGATNAGSAYLYDLNGTLLATITNPAPAVDDYFGNSVAGVGPNRFVVGASYDDAGATGAGSVYLYNLGNTANVVAGLVADSVAPHVIGTEQLAPDAVTSDALATGAVSTEKLATDSVTSDKIATGAVGSEAIAVAAVSNAALAANAVTGDKIADGTISNADVAANAAIAASKIAGSALVQTNTFGGDVSGTFNNLQLVAGAVGTTELAINVVTTTNIVDGTITTNDLNLASVDGRYVKKAGDTMTGPLTNQQTITAARFVNSSNDAAGANSVALGGVNNTISSSASYGAIGGGIGNEISTGASYSVIGGGYSNYAGVGSVCVTIGGGDQNLVLVNSDYTTIGGGQFNVVNDSAQYSVIGGGFANTVENGSGYSFIGSGYSNLVDSASAAVTIGGGDRNHVLTNSAYATISGGRYNVIEDNSGYSVIAGGRTNRIGNASGYSFIAGGYGNEIGDSAQYAFAAGRRAKANHAGALVWSDSTDADAISTNANSVTMRASGGYRLFSNSGMTLGAQLAPNAPSWSALSDRNAKENFEPIDSAAILNKVAELPLTAWTYKADPDHRRYIGPMAQDFQAAFGLGNDTSINTLDTDGIVLAAIQALAKQNAELKAELNALKARLDAIEKR